MLNPYPNPVKPAGMGGMLGAMSLPQNGSPNLGQPTNTTGTTKMPNHIKIGKNRKIENPFNYQPRYDFGQYNQDLQGLRNQQVDPAVLYRQKADAITGNARAEDDAVAGDIISNRLGPAAALQYRARAGQNTSALLGQAAGASQLEAKDTNAGILSQVLQALLGQAGVYTSESGQRYGQNQANLGYMMGGL